MSAVAGGTRGDVPTIVIAPDSFKGTVGAAEAAACIAAGWRSRRSGDHLVLLPMADGGEGTLDAFAAVGPSAIEHVTTVLGPHDRPVVARWIMLERAAGGRTAVVELAEASGITLLSTLRPLSAHTYGMGQLIRAGIDQGADELVLGLGGSASTDGGAGALAALGARFLDRSGKEVARGNGGLGEIHSIDLSRLVPPPAGGVRLLTDVDAPLLGPKGAVAVFGPQKGITAEVADRAERNLAHFAQMVDAMFGLDSGRPGAGAAGGTGYGLQLIGGRFEPGASAVSDALGLRDAIRSASLVITGEGRFDRQTADVKVPGFIARMAAEEGVPALLVAGDIEGTATSFAFQLSLTAIAGNRHTAINTPRRWLEQAGAWAADHFHDVSG